MFKGHALCISPCQRLTYSKKVRILVQTVKMHNEVRRVPRENSSRLQVKDVVPGQHNVVLALIWYALQGATRLM